MTQNTAASEPIQDENTTHQGGGVGDDDVGADAGQEGKEEVTQNTAASEPIQDKNTARHGGDDDVGVDAGREGKEEAMQSIAASELIQDKNTAHHGGDDDVGVDAGQEGKEEVTQSVAASEPIQDENTACHGVDAGEEEVVQKDVENAGQEGKEKADIAASEPKNENEPDEKDDAVASEPENENKPDNDASQGKKASHNGDCDLGPANKLSDAAEKLSENEKTPHDADADLGKKPPENKKPLSEICLDEKRRLVLPPPSPSTIVSLREKVLSWDTASQFSLFPSASPVKKPGMPNFQPCENKMLR